MTRKERDSLRELVRPIYTAMANALIKKKREKLNITTIDHKGDRHTVPVWGYIVEFHDHDWLEAFVYNQMVDQPVAYRWWVVTELSTGSIVAEASTRKKAVFEAQEMLDAVTQKRIRSFEAKIKECVDKHGRVN